MIKPRAHLNHETIYRHSPFYSEELTKQANPRCKHCYGTGSPGVLSTVNMEKGFAVVNQPLVCACAVRSILSKGDVPWESK